MLHDPIRVSVTPDRPTVDLIDQSVVYVDKADKRAYLAALIRAQAATRAIVFTRTKHGADRLAKALESSGIATAAIHAKKSQNNRTRTLDSFRSGDIRVLVATDLAARGIDVDGISHVYNYELPEVPETYVHRIGRTARAGAQGEAVALCDNEEKPFLRAIEKLLRAPVPLARGPAFETARISAAADRALGPPPLVDRGERRQPLRRGGPARERTSSSSPRDSRSASRMDPRRKTPPNPRRERSDELSRSASGPRRSVGQGSIRT